MQALSMLAHCMEVIDCSSLQGNASQLAAVLRYAAQG